MITFHNIFRNIFVQQELNPAMRTASGRGVDDVLSHTGCDMMMNDDSMEGMAADEPMTSSESPGIYNAI